VNRGGLVAQVRGELLTRINDGVWQPGDRLPAESRLAEDLSVSRATLREALKSLQDEGFLSRTRGAGTYLTSRPRPKNNLELNFGVTDLIRSMGREPGTAHLQVSQRPCTAEESERLNLPDHSDVYVVERVRTADEVPIALCVDVIGRDTIEAGTLGGLLAKQSFYAVLHANGIQITHGAAVITATVATDEHAEALGIEPGELLMRLTQVDYDVEDRPILLSDELHVASAFEMTVHRRGPDLT
jgi:GntR family transcriptional regulator